MIKYEILLLLNFFFFLLFTKKLFDHILALSPRIKPSNIPELFEEHTIAQKNL